MEERFVLECRSLHHAFGEKQVLHDVNIKLLRGEIVALVGPSGCGKSTLLRAILGTHPPKGGEVVVYRHKGKDVSPVAVTSPGRDRGIVYQRYSLFPHLTARENVAVGLMLDQTSIPFRLFRIPTWRAMRKQHLREADEMLEKVNLAGAGHQYPHELSGGMCQRVAIAQALILKPEILLLDEPFGALDEATREELQRMLLNLYGENIEALNRGDLPPYTILMVTHELNEALYVSDRVLGLSQYWDWKAAKHIEFPGATIVYDNAAPISHPDEPRRYEEFSNQKQQILKSTFDPEELQHREEWRRFWHQVHEGKTGGVLKI